MINYQKNHPRSSERGFSSSFLKKSEIKPVNLRFPKLYRPSVYIYSILCYTDCAKKQKELADLLNITDKSVSKWERDLACPEMTLPNIKKPSPVGEGGPRSGG